MPKLATVNVSAAGAAGFQRTQALWPGTPEVIASLELRFQRHVLGLEGQKCHTKANGPVTSVGYSHQEAALVAGGLADWWHDFTGSQHSPQGLRPPHGLPTVLLGV